MKLIIAFVFSLIAFSSAWGHGDSHQHSESVENVRDFTHLAHHELEGSFWEALNPYQILLRAHRFYNMKSEDAQFGEHTKNLALLLPFSEALELSTGPAVTRFTLNNDFPLWMDGLMNFVGWGISVPGFLEPYCLAVIGTYAAVKPVQRGVTALRVGLTRAVNGACEISGAKDFLNRRWPRIDVLDAFLRQGWSAVNGSKKNVFLLTKEIAEDSWIGLELSKGENNYVTTISYENISRKKLKKLLAPLNWGARALLLNDYSKPSDFREYSNQEIRVKAQRSICDGLFRSS